MRAWCEDIQIQATLASNFRSWWEISPPMVAQASWSTTVVFATHSTFSKNSDPFFIFLAYKRELIASGVMCTSTPCTKTEGKLKNLSTGPWRPIISCLAWMSHKTPRPTPGITLPVHQQDVARLCWWVGGQCLGIPPLDFLYWTTFMAWRFSWFWRERTSPLLPRCQNGCTSPHWQHFQELWPCSCSWRRRRRRRTCCYACLIVPF